MLGLFGRYCVGPLYIDDVDQNNYYTDEYYFIPKIVKYMYKVLSTL